ncbi:MAG: TM2 domain-containing protein, partial [Symploca sp. SIO1C4]|nr:TM2 domain-containing protein [Symploca sp. SIO1C4]
MLSKPKSRKVAALIAFMGTILPVSGFHKFYLGQPLWGLMYLLLFWTPIPRIASAIEFVWYLGQNQDEFDRNFNGGALRVNSSVSTQPTAIDPAKVGEVADALRQLDKLRQEGLVSE